MTHADHDTKFAPAEVPQPQASTSVPARNRRERLARALSHLDEAGITRATAYPSAFRVLARLGLVLKPLHYRSFPGLTLFSFVLLTVILGGLIAVSLAIGITPRPVRAMLEVGLAGFLGINALLGFVFSALIRMRAIGADLPHWRDL